MICPDIQESSIGGYCDLPWYPGILHWGILWFALISRNPPLGDSVICPDIQECSFGGFCDLPWYPGILHWGILWFALISRNPPFGDSVICPDIQEFSIWRFCDLPWYTGIIHWGILWFVLMPRNPSLEDSVIYLDTQESSTEGLCDLPWYPEIFPVKFKLKLWKLYHKTSVGTLHKEQWSNCVDNMDVYFREVCLQMVCGGTNLQTFLPDTIKLLQCSLT